MRRACKEPDASWAHLAITLDDEPVGTVGYGMGEEHWGRGCATEALGLATELAFAEYDLARLTGHGVRVESPRPAAGWRSTTTCARRAMSAASSRTMD